jgi:hypothetical protein
MTTTVPLTFKNSGSARNSSFAAYGLPASWTVLGLVVAWSFWGTVGKPDCQDMDFGSYYRAATTAACGDTPYALDEHGPLGAYAYAPVHAYLFIPLSYLDYLWACRVWLVLNWAATGGGVMLALRLARGPHGKLTRIWPLVGLAVLPVSAYLWANLRSGQAGMIMVVSCLGWMWCRRQGRRFTGGLLLAVACSLKLAPGVLIPYLLLRRDLRGMVGVVAGAVALFLLPALWVGLEGTVRLHGEWVRHTMATQIPEQTCRRGNQSLLAQLARLPAISRGEVCVSHEQLALLERTYPFLVLALGSVLYCWAAGVSRDPRWAGADWQCENLVLAVLLIFLTVAHPRAWRCNYVALLLPCMILGERLRRRFPGSWTGLAALALVALATVWPSAGAAADGWTLAGWLLLGKHFWAAVAVGAACWWAARHVACAPARITIPWRAAPRPPAIWRTHHS